MKGHMQDGKFHPHSEYKKGVRKSRDQNAKSEGVKIRKARSEIKPNLPKAYTPAWDKLKKNVEGRFDHDFNEIKLENLQSVNQNWFEDVISTEPRMEDIKDHFGESSLSDAKFKKQHSESEIEDAKQELMDEQREIMWGTLFEAKDTMLAEKIKENSEALINDAGITIVDMSNSDKADSYQTGVFLGINGAGYDFYEQHWVPMYRIFGWI